MQHVCSDAARGAGSSATADAWSINNIFTTFQKGGGTNTVSLHMRHCICSKQDFNEEFITANRGRGDTCVRYDTHFFKAVDRELHQVKTERFASSSLFKPNFAGETVQLSLYTHSAKKPLSVSQL